MADIKKQTNEALKKDIMQKHEELRIARFGGAGSRARDVRAVRKNRREVARMETELSARRAVAKNTNNK